MIIFYLTLFVSWWLTKVFWGDKAAKYSLFAIIPIGALLFVPLWQDDLALSIVVSFFYVLGFVFINLLCFMVLMFRQIDWRDPETKRQFLFELLNAVNKKGSGSYSSSSYGEYVIQYRSGSTWIDGPGSNNERVAESMFDQFITNDSRSNNRCRLVYKVNGRVQFVVSTN